MRDTNLALRADGAAALTADDLTPAWVDFGAPDINPMTYQLVVPAAGGTTPTLLAVIQEAEDASGTGARAVLTFEPITAAGIFYVTGRMDGRFRRLTLDVGGTTPDFGSVECYPILNGDYTEF